MTVYQLKPVERPFTVDALYNAIDVVRPQGFYYSGEMHDFWEAVFVVNGQATATADEKVIALRGGHFFFQKPMEFHRIWSENDTAPHLQILTFHTVGEGMRYFEGRCMELTPREQQRFARTCKKVAGAVALYDPAQPKEGYAGAAFDAALAVEMLLLALRDHVPADEHDLTPGARRFREILQVLHAHCEEDLSVEQLAELCGCSVSNMKRIFSRYSDRGVAKYFLTIKIQRAMQLLDAGVPAAEVAQRLGFAETGYFHTVFRRETGMTPGTYRHACKNERYFIRQNKDETPPV